MKELSDIENHCARALDLVAYLYGEANEAEAKDFERHMQRCAPCANELEALGHVRAHVGAWRTETLSALTSPALATVQESAAQVASARRRSALAAVREFFALSPMWLRGATAFASLAVCALVVYAAVTLLEGPRVVTVEKEKVVEKGPTQAEINALVDKRVEQELALRERREDATLVMTPVSAQKDSVVARSAASRTVALARQSSTQRRAVAQVSAQESEQFARDLQLIPTRDEEDLPRLIDLMDESN